jgi:hypothetical protein
MLAWLRGLFDRRREEDVPPPPPERVELLSEEERERHRQEILEREVTLRTLEAKARLRRVRPW